MKTEVAHTKTQQILKRNPVVLISMLTCALIVLAVVGLPDPAEALPPPRTYYGSAGADDVYIGRSCEWNGSDWDCSDNRTAICINPGLGCTWDDWSNASAASVNLFLYDEDDTVTTTHTTVVDCCFDYGVGLWNTSWVKPFLDVDAGIDNDQIEGTPLNDVLDGNDGDDIIWGFGGADHITGGDGDDTLYGGDGANEIWGQNQDDEIHGGADVDFIVGGWGNDVIYGKEGDDEIYGDDYTSSSCTLHTCNDIIYGGEGSDEIHGGPDVDCLDGNRAAGDDDVLYGDGGICNYLRNASDCYCGEPSVPVDFADISTCVNIIDCYYAMECNWCVAYAGW